MTRDGRREDDGSSPPEGELSTVSELYEVLRRRILDGSLRPGAPVSQVKLSRELGVHRTPLREALRMLQREGLVDAEPNRRVRIATMSIEGIEDLYARRVLLEVLAVRVGTPRFESDDFARMDAELAALDTHASPQELEQWDQAHRQLHALLSSRAGPRLAAEIAEVYDHASRYRRLLTEQGSPQAFDRAASEHRAIVEACSGGNPEEAGFAVARHLGRAFSALLAVVDPAYDAAAMREALRICLAGSKAPSGALTVGIGS